MTHAEIDALIESRIQEAAKTLKLGDSHQQLHRNLQKELTSEHRSAYDGSDYEEYPYVEHTFGDNESGHVVYSQGDARYAAPYKKHPQGGYQLGEPQSMQMAYVGAPEMMKEALQTEFGQSKAGKILSVLERYISPKARKEANDNDFAGKGRSFPILKPEDVTAAAHALGRAGSGNYSTDELKQRIISIARKKGWENKLPKAWREGGEKTKDDESKESATIEEMTVIQEAAVDKSGLMKIKLIAPGTGSMGHYTQESLQQAAKDRVFSKGTQMFIDHPSDEDMKRSGTGSLKNLAAVLESDASYDPQGPDGPGLYADAKAFSDYRDFIKERAKDIGISINAGVQRSRSKFIDGVPVVEKFVKALSTDFVSAAGAGGKLITVYESFRSKQDGGKGPKPQTQESEMKVEIEETELKTLRESASAVPGLLARLDRLEESNQRNQALQIVNEALSDSGLNARGQQRVITLVTANLPMKDGKLDVEKVKESAKNAVADEVAYVTESGGRLGTPVVRGIGYRGTGSQKAEGTDDVVLQESGKLLDNSVNVLLGKEVAK